MPLYLYRYTNLFGAIGAGTPEDPGTDFMMSVWIEALDEQAALDRGHVLLADYVRARHRHEDPGFDIAPGVLKGWLEADSRVLAEAADAYPRCRVGEIPAWEAPWRHSNTRKPRDEGRASRAK